MKVLKVGRMEREEMWKEGKKEKNEVLREREAGREYMGVYGSKRGDRRENGCVMGVCE